MTTTTIPTPRAAALLLAGLLFALTGCKAPIADQDLQTMDQQLGPAGFVRRDADTMERRAHLQSLEQNALIGRAQAGGTTWVYADAKGCGCLYVGRDQQYAELQGLLAGEEKARAIAAATHPAPNYSGSGRGDGDGGDGGGGGNVGFMDWALWGPWDDVPWYDDLTY